MKKAVLFASVAALLAIGWNLTFAQAGKRSDSVVTAKAKLSDKAPAGKSVVVVSLAIKSGWHLYANPVGNEDLESGQLVVSAKGDKVAVEYPAGKLVNDPLVGKHKIYEDTIEVRVTLDRAVTAANKVDLSLRLQACDEKTCLLPATVNLTVP